MFADALKHLGFEFGVLAPNNVDVRNWPTPTLGDGAYPYHFDIEFVRLVTIGRSGKTSCAAHRTNEDIRETT